MLHTLHIRDLALIEALDVEFGRGLNIVTGETGAGKSILVGAMKLILGDRASTDVVRPGAKRAVVEGTFRLNDGSEAARTVRRILVENDIDMQPELILRRQVSASQSRAFINDTPVTATLLRDVAGQLVDLHGQHEHVSLLRTEHHLDLVDAFGGLGGEAEACRTAYDEARALHARREALRSKAGELQRERDLLQFQVEDIDAVAPTAGEEDLLDEERRRMEHAERLFELTARLQELLFDGEMAVNNQLAEAKSLLKEATRIDPAFDSTLQEMISAQIMTGEAASFAQEYQSDIAFNEERLEFIRSRLSAIDALKRKYGGTLEAVLAFREDIGERFDMASDVEGTLKRLDEEFGAACRRLSDAAFAASAARRQAAQRLSELVVEQLATLGMPRSRFDVHFEHRERADGWATHPDTGAHLEAGPRGVDQATFMISTNPGMDVMPLSRVASGGETSRIMLAMKSILAQADRLPVLIFDEIDTGISGAVAQRVAISLRALSEHHQVIAVTHLPQVAASGHAHFTVEKHIETAESGEITRTVVRRLSDEEREHEVAALLSGEEITETALASARELLAARLD